MIKTEEIARYMATDDFIDEEVKNRLPSFYPKLVEYYKKIENGERDIYF